MKMLMMQLNNVLDPCNAPKARKKSLFSESDNPDSTLNRSHVKIKRKQRSRNLYNS